MQDIIKKAKDIIWNNQGITPYKLLEKLINLNVFDSSKDGDFENIIQQLINSGEVRHDKGLNMLYAYKTVNIPVKTMKGKRANCYDCLFLTKTQDMPWREVNSDKINGYMDRSKDDKVACTLNPLMEIEELSMNYIPDECPLNKAFKMMETMGEVDKC